MSRASDYINKCREAERIRPKFIPDVDSLFYAEITPDGNIRLTREEFEFTLNIDELKRFTGWVLRIIQDE